ncbi:hypothetical protein [Vulcanisaeta distributa]|uniref:hypothetical protein n=1 Tax=Vulcanisaeta distributa TaxID=164451 RepID=UPI0006D0BAA0|nr:hypothetical protein [Vulcanisaeta distributa]
MSKVNVNAQVKVKYCDGTWCNFQYFRCAKKALKIVRQGNRVVTQCTLFGGPCIGYKCQYAVCEAHVMAPDGRCLLDLRNMETKERDIVEEAKKLDKQASVINKHLKKLGLKDYM